MKKLVSLLFPILILAASCGSVKVSTDYDKAAEFSSYKTYTYTTQAMTIPLNGVSENLLLHIIDAEMAAKGFTKTENHPDVLIDLKVKTKNLETVSTTPGLYSGWGYGSGYIYGWSGSFTTSTINFDNYTDGTLFIDMIDAAKKQLVWQGRGKKTIDPNGNQSDREKNISVAVHQIFTRYPPKK